MKQFISKIDHRIKFLMVGGTAFIVDMSIFTGLLYLGVNHNISQIIAYTTSAIVNFLANKYLTFENYQQTTSQIWRFLLWNVTYLVLSTLLLNLLIYLGAQSEGQFDLDLNKIKIISKAIVVLILTIVSYAVMKLIIFKEK